MNIILSGSGMKKTTFTFESDLKVQLSQVKPVTVVSKNSQSGAVLIIALILLLIITSIGLSSVGSTSLEVQMAANAQFKNVIFQESENAIESVALNMVVLGSAYSASITSVDWPSGDVEIDDHPELEDDEFSYDDLTRRYEVQFVGFSKPKGESAGSIRIGASGYSLYNFKIRGTAAMANVGASNTNVRGAYIYGPSVAD